MKTNLFGLTPDQLKSVVTSLSLPAFTATQLADWMYKKRIVTFSEMTNLSKQSREKLEVDYCVNLTQATKVQTSTDGTKKYL
ncbi:MAG: 23S rRNA (adenine(2503)-C(2))-methyltransferase RlmN, partial [Paludibacter sp.]